ILGPIGPNGSGKTTLLETVAGLLPVDAGSVLWQRSLLPQHRRREVVFYLPDGVRPWDGRHVIGVLEFFASAFGRRAAELDEVTPSVGLEELLGKHVFALSKGYVPKWKAISTVSYTWSTNCRSPSLGASACGPKPTVTCTSTTIPSRQPIELLV